MVTACHGTKVKTLMETSTVSAASLKYYFILIYD